MDLCQLCTQHDAMGGYLCPGCTRDTVVRLECLPTLYAGLLSFLAPSASIGQGRAGKGGPAPLPVREAVLDLRGPGGMVGVVEDWLSSVRDERRMAQPARPTASVEGRLSAAVTGLIGQMPWIAVSWPQAGTFAAEIREVVRSARSIIAPHDPVERGIRLGTCPAVDSSGTICGAVLTYRRGEMVVTCPWCTCTYPPAMWAGLKVFIDKDAKVA